MSNRLKFESSPYLLQHANNPVDWYAWGDEAFKRAFAEDKLVIVSIGYSACHWCHVMEHESFEDTSVADIMNQHFVSVKVDREERPDIDQVYMSAVQLMTGRGGWPLNCIILPDGRPVYGGTYFTRKQWINILTNLAELYKTDKTRLIEYAAELTAGINKAEQLVISDESSELTLDTIGKSVTAWQSGFDTLNGGPNRAPKFPLPDNYLFLLQYARFNKDKNLSDHIKLTLDNMALGGIFDHLGGGWYRYSVDAIWKVPHFEKMLYDNAQLISLYSGAHTHFNRSLYKEVVYKTFDFIESELKGREHNYFCAIDADSEKEEGKYYVWNRDELISALGDDFDLFCKLYHIDQDGLWEHGNYILIRKQVELPGGDGDEKKLRDIHSRLLNARKKRIRPGTDDKTLASWNALLITGYLDAYNAFADEKFRDTAVDNARFILKNMVRDDGGLYHNYKNGKSSINGYLEDYAFFIYALIRLYESTFEYHWIELAKNLVQYTERYFDSDDKVFFYFTSSDDPALISRQRELQDNVIPSSNSQMAHNLFLLGHYFEKSEWITRSQAMCAAMKDGILTYGSAYSHWMMVWMYHASPLKELVICGKNALTIRSELAVKMQIPGLIIAGCVSTENIPLTRGRLVEEQTKIYVCKNHSCSLPVADVNAALDLLSD